MNNCECGCGVEAASEFLPGHDQKLRAALERRIGGLLALRGLVEAATEYANGKSVDAEFTRVVRAVIARAPNSQAAR